MDEVLKMWLKKNLESVAKRTHGMAGTESSIDLRWFVSGAFDLVIGLMGTTFVSMT